MRASAVKADVKCMIAVVLAAQASLARIRVLKLQEDGNVSKIDSGCARVYNICVVNYFGGPDLQGRLLMTACRSSQEHRIRTSATIVFRNPLPKPVMEGPSSKTNLWWITCLTAISAGKRDASMVVI